MSIFGKRTRREFLLKTSSAALCATVPLPSREESTTASPLQNPRGPEDLFKVGVQRTFEDDRAAQVAVPLGGIGAGCMCLNGYGGLQDFSIFNRPTLTALPGDGLSRPFALLHIKSRSTVTRLVEGPLPVSKIFDQGLQGQGYFRGGADGLPRFEKCVFKGEYPLSEVTVSDRSIPLRVGIVGWNPFIPLDAKNSGIPCLILEYSFRNTSSKNVDYEFSYHLPHFASGCKNEGRKSRNTVIPGQGVFLHNVEDTNAEAFGSVCLLAIGHEPKIKGMWLRSDWEFDAGAALWREVSTGSFTANNGSNDADTTGPNGGSILFAGSLSPGESHTYPIVISWYFPNAYIRVGGVLDAGSDEDDTVQSNVGCRTAQNGVSAPWRPYYASVWSDARDVASYVKENYASLRARTSAFKDALFSSTFPPYVLDAISANLAILKSPTVLRVENGNLWGWEGCAAEAGCGHGSCTHVWNYAQAFANLFPQLERSLREQELMRSMDEKGHISFRAALPEGPTKHDYHSAADGQLGGIMKVFREWQISGDSAWLKKIYPLVKRSLDYCIRTWDPERRGALFEPHHNTYDIEFWGPNGMCTSIYLGALCAFVQMAEAEGETQDAKQYRELAQDCARFLDETLFNGEYYEQKVQYEGLRDTSFAEMVSHVDEHSSEMQKLLKREGPRYQYGNGCLSDGIIGDWMARTYGIETPLSGENLRKSLQAIFKNNFKSDLSEHANVQRPGYALGHEPGLLLCTWPHGGKPTLPFVYSDEAWTGIEYQVASHLISHGFVTEGLTIVRALRSRYDGRIRNPWNEYEYGNYYARAMASYALLSALSGFRYSAIERTLWFGPQLRHRPFVSFFCAASGFGTVALGQKTLRIRMMEGELELKKIVLTENGRSKSLDLDETARPGSPVITSI